MEIFREASQTLAASLKIQLVNYFKHGRDSSNDFMNFKTLFSSQLREIYLYPFAVQLEGETAVLV